MSQTVEPPFAVVPPSVAAAVVAAGKLRWIADSLGAADRLGAGHLSERAPYQQPAAACAQRHLDVALQYRFQASYRVVLRSAARSAEFRQEPARAQRSL